jgi:hypothetical protein
MDLQFKGACRACVAEHCCNEAAACDDGACGDDITLPITPLMSVSEKFDALASCMLANCDAETACNVSWGCVGKYKWPVLREAHPFSIRVFNYADSNEIGIPKITVRQCDSTDPVCTDGLVAMTVTDAAGLADFTATRGFNGYFELEGGGPATSTIAWSKPVYNVADSFTHQALRQEAVQGLAVAVRFHDKLDQPFKSGTGFLISRIQNCLPLRYMEEPNPIARARDVKLTFTPSSGASRMYYLNDMASLDASLDRTSTRAYGGAFEVLAGNVTVTAKHAETGKVLAMGVLPVREAEIGFMYLVPDSAP